VIADGGAQADYVAADLLSQAEHDSMASALLITTDESVALETEEVSWSSWLAFPGRILPKRR